jgi:hypothetical protein
LQRSPLNSSDSSIVYTDFFKQRIYKINSIYQWDTMLLCEKDLYPPKNIYKIYKMFHWWILKFFNESQLKFTQLSLF